MKMSEREGVDDYGPVPENLREEELDLTAQDNDEYFQEKYGFDEYWYMVDEKYPEYKYEIQSHNPTGYWSEEDDIDVLEQVGFTKKEATYLVKGPSGFVHSEDPPEVIGVMDESGEFLYTESQIKEAVDIIIGDDGGRSSRVLEVLKIMRKGGE